MFKCCVFLICLTIASALPVQDEFWKTEIDEFGDIMDKLASVFEKGGLHRRDNKFFKKYFIRS